MTTYAIVKWNPGFDRARFDQAKGQGVQQTSIDTVRKSVDGKFAVLKWSGEAAQLPAAIGANLVATYDHAGILTEMGKPEWARPLPRGSRTVSAQIWRIAAIGLSAAAAGTLAYFLLT